VGVKERFAPEEWQQLKLFPLLAFNFALLRLARERPQDVDPDHARQFFWSMLEAAPTEPIFRELTEDIAESDWPSLAEEATASDILALVEPLERIRRIASGALSRKEYNTFATAVITAGVLPFQGLSSEAQSVWVSAWADLNKILGLDLQAAARSLRRQQEGTA
jgi:hypothetical protein